MSESPPIQGSGSSPSIPIADYDYIVLQQSGKTNAYDSKGNLKFSQTAATSSSGDDATLISQVTAIMTAGQRLLLYGNLFVKTAIPAILVDCTIDNKGGLLSIISSVSVTIFTFGDATHSPTVIMNFEKVSVT